MLKSGACKRGLRIASVLLLCLVSAFFLLGLHMLIHAHYCHDYDHEETAAGGCAVCLHLQSTVKTAAYSLTRIFAGVFTAAVSVSAVSVLFRGKSLVSLKIKMNN